MPPAEGTGCRGGALRRSYEQHIHKVQSQWQEKKVTLERKWQEEKTAMEAQFRDLMDSAQLAWRKEKVRCLLSSHR